MEKFFLNVVKTIFITRIMIVKKFILPLFKQDIHLIVVTNRKVYKDCLLKNHMEQKHSENIEHNGNGHSRPLSYILSALDERVLFPKRFEYLENKLAPYLEGYNRVLDLGAGCGRLSKRLQDKTGIEFIGADKHIQKETAIPVIEYDGKNLPFADNSFDCVMIIDTLHHDKDMSTILKEAKRVSREGILIKDHYYKNSLGFAVLSVADYIGNIPYGVDIPYNFLTMKEWTELFEKNGLKINKQEQFRFKKIDPTKQVIFQLNK